MVHAKGLPAVVDGTDDIVVAITTTGVAAIDLTLEAPDALRSKANQHSGSTFWAECSACHACRSQSSV